MVTLLDTDRLPATERRPAQVAARLEAAMVSRIRFPDDAGPSRARLDAWDLGGVSVLRLELSGELLLSGPGPREDTAPAVSFAVQEQGVAMQHHLGRRQVVPTGGLALTEVA